jgi:hypothetical protein
MMHFEMLYECQMQCLCGYVVVRKNVYDRLQSTALETSPFLYAD